MSALHSIYRLIHSTYDLPDLGSKLTKLLSQIFKADGCTFALLGPSKFNPKRKIAIKCSITNNKRFVSTQKTAVKNKIEQKIISTGCAIKKDGMIATPLIHEDVMGFIVLSRSGLACRREGAFDAYDLEALMTIANQIILAIKTIELYAEQEKTVMGTIKSLVAVLDSKMPPAYTHTPHFSKLVVAIAEELHLRKEEIDSLRYASMLHDAGKINIPTEILTKASQLTGEEYDIIKRHPVRGAEILKHMEILKPVVPIIMHHHEKFDGSGYPSHLKKGKIPIGARVMSVADAFDAMVYGRPYKERMDVDMALEEIKKYSGSQFDPLIVKCLVKILHNKKLKKYLNLTT